MDEQDYDPEEILASFFNSSINLNNDKNLKLTDNSQTVSIVSHPLGGRTRSSGTTVNVSRNIWASRRNPQFLVKPATFRESETYNDNTILAIGIKKIRRKKMNKHKLKKRRRLVRNSTRYNKERLKKERLEKQQQSQ
jgi:hypothetical protein